MRISALIVQSLSVARIDENRGGPRRSLSSAPPWG